MQRFKVIQYRDAVIRYEVDIEAASPEAALALAVNAECAWEKRDVHQQDHADMEVQDANGLELLTAPDVW